MREVLQYQPHFLLAIELDAEWSRVRGSTEYPHPLAVLKTRIENICCDYRGSLEKFGRSYAIKHPTYHPTSFPQHLFSPIFCLPSGHADGLAFILADDFDAVHHIASHSRVIEDMVLGYCPTVVSLGYADHACVKDSQAHWADPTLPVRMLSRYKLDGVCNLEFGLLLKRAVFRAMVRRVDQCIAYFDQRQSESERQERRFVVTFLCLQGQEEIGVLCSSNDVTIAVALSAALRSLTFPDLFPADDADPLTIMLRNLLLERDPTPRGRNYYAPGQLHRFVFPKQETPGAELHELRIPVFRWSKSVIGFGLNDTGGGLSPSGKMQGLVSLDLDFQFTPGVSVAIAEFSSVDESSQPIPPGWRFLEVGAFDSRHTIGVTRPAFPIEIAVRHILNSITRIVQANRNKDRIGIVGIRSVFSVATPNEPPFTVVGATIESKLDYSLFEIRRRIDGPNKGSFMSMEDLLAIPIKYRLPRALRRSLESLFRNFLTALANPNLFDLIIDLYDAFSTLHRLLTTVIPAKLSEQPGNYVSIRPRTVKELAEFATILRNALERRLALAYPDSTVRNVSLQFPGSLAQILLAADAPLKAGIGVLKYHLPVDRQYDNKAADDEILRSLHHIGVVADITLEPGIRAVNILMETVDKDPLNKFARLSYLCLDVDHLFNVGSFFDYIHEAFHLVFDALVTRKQSTKGEQLARIVLDAPFIKERAEETFVQLASFVFCSPDRPRELLSYLVGKYALDIKSAEGNEASRISFFAEHFVRMCIPCWLVYTRLSDRQRLTDDFSWQQEILDFAKDELPVVFALFPETASLSLADTQKVQEACIEHVSVFLEEGQFSYYLPHLWDLILDLYGKLSEDQPGFRLEQRQEHQPALDLLAEGWAITRHDLDAAKYINSVAATALILGQFITRHSVFQNPGMRYQVDRDPKTGEINFLDCVYGDYLIDRGAAQRFCFKPDARGKRLQNQIAILGSFWDLSSHLRARRVMDLIMRFNLE